jgi:hypothetical protein
MMIDERLEKLTERHEALTQSIELLRISQEETEKRFKRIADVFPQTDGFINSVTTALGSIGSARARKTEEVGFTHINPSDSAGT